VRDGLVIDLFAGGGGASTGIEAALGRHVDVAVNHSELAIAVHTDNHPETEHLTSDLRRTKPENVIKGRPVFLLWASPDCRDHSNAKGGRPRRQKTRSLPWVVVRWIRACLPDLVVVENVPEFEGWGPLDEHGKRIKARKGEFFRLWRRQISRYGYRVQHRVLDASQYGAPTRRKRFFLIARRDGIPIRWPAPTHGPGLVPFHTAAECIDWRIPCPSIFERKKPLAEKTMWRIAQGLKRFVFENPRPFILKVNHGKWEPRHESIDEPLSTVTATQRGHGLVVASIAPMNADNPPMGIDRPLGTITSQHNRFGLVAPVLQQSGWGERPTQRARVLDLQQPLGTVVADGQKHALVAAWLARHFGDPLRSDGGGGVVTGKGLDEPMPTITARDHHSLAAVTLAKFRGTGDDHPGCADVREPMPTISSGGGRGGVHVAEVRAFLTAYYGSDGTGGQELLEPLRTITAKARLGLVTVEGIDYQVTDIGFRMVEPDELKRAQFGRFAEAYDLSKARTKAAKIWLLGNTVPPELSEAVVRANKDTSEELAA
jgi:DNA (cytosine-5)-methyltransferase 1